MAETLTLADLNLSDDLDIDINPDTYQDQTSPAPPAAGKYAFRVKKHSVRTNKDGSIKLTDGTYPIINLQSVEIVEGLDSPRSIGLLQDIRTKPFMRNGFPVSMAGDLLRAFDQTRRAKGTEVLEALNEFFGSGAVARGLFDWTAYDSEAARAAIDGLGGKVVLDAMTKQEVNDFYSRFKVKGMKNFPITLNGRHNHFYTFPSGNVVEARVEIVRFYPSEEIVRLGSN